MKMDEVEPMVLLKVIRLFEDRGAMERADKARRRCGEVFSYAIVTGRAKFNPSRDLAGAIRGYRKKNSPFLPIHRISGRIFQSDPANVTELQVEAVQKRELR